jgi:hypothetical protein
MEEDMKKFVLHNGSDEAKTEELHEFLNGFDWHSSGYGITISMPAKQADEGDTIVRRGDSVSVIARDSLDGENDVDDDMFVAGVLLTVGLLAKVLGVEQYETADGSEDFNTDLSDTLLNVLAARGLYDKGSGTFAVLEKKS